MTTNELTEKQILAQAKYNKVLEQARIRQKKWYDLNKPKVLEKKKQEWKKLRSEILGINHSQYNQNAIINEPSSDEQHYDHTQEDNNYHNDTQQQTVVEPTAMPKLRKSGRPKVVMVTIQHIISSLEEKIRKKEFTAKDKEGTINTRLGDMKTIQRIMPNCKNFKKCLEKPDELIDSIKNADKKNENRRNPDASTKYKTNSRKTYFATILWVIDTFHIDLPNEVKQKYIQTLELLKQKSTQEHDLKKQNSEYINFNTMLEKIKIKFGKESKEYLLIRCYDLICARDNYCKMIIVENKNEISDEDKFNYMIIPKDKKKNCIIFLQEFKTNGRYNNAEEKCNMDLSKLIREYVQAKKLNYGDFIFGKTSLSKFIGFILDSIGAKRENEAINYLRHSKLTTEFLTKNLTDEEKAILMDKMKHSFVTQYEYVRKLVVEDN